MNGTSLDHTARLLEIMARLRHREKGCDWDRAQTFATIAPYTLEEAYEVADAIARGDMDDLRDELGDLLLQVVFHARIAEELGLFAFEDVAAAISAKMERRHPHIFAQVETPGQGETWEGMKAAERKTKAQDGVLDGVALALPALKRSEKLQKRAARVGFDWPKAAQAGEKLTEEIAELNMASSMAEQFEEAGDLLFAAVNWLRKLEIAPEDALRAANAKFERRFAAMEALARSDETDFKTLALEQQEALWQAVKSQEA